MKKIALILAALTMATAAAAQDRDGNDTPGEWVITHHTSIDLWDSMCDERTTGDTKEERCYIRYVDVFSGRPNFAAQFLFLTPQDNGIEIAFGVEAGTLFDNDGFQVRQAGDVLWEHLAGGCLLRSCTFRGEWANALLGAMIAGDAFAFSFNDRHGVEPNLSWNLTRFDAVLADFQEQAKARALME